MTLVHIALTIAGLVLLVATLPLALELLVLSCAALLQPRPVRVDDADFALAVIVPAHNEQQLIATCVRSILDNSSASVRVYVVAHNCSDATAAHAESAGAQVLELNDQTGGKGVALDHGFAHALAAGAQGVLVIDADSVVGPNLVRAIAGRLAAGAAALQCRYQVSNAEASTRTRLAALAFLGMNVLRPRGRDRLGLSCGIFGNGFALSAATLRAVPYTANSLVEDLEYHLNLIRAGIRVEFVDDAAVYGEMPAGSAAATSQRARWEGGRILMRRTWSGPLLREVLRGRLAMLEPLLDLRALPLATEAALLLGALGLALVGRLPWLVVYSAGGLGAILLYVLASATLGPEPGATLRALAAVPGYMAWKVMMIPRTRLASRRDAAWVRTARNPQDERPSSD